MAGADDEGVFDWEVPAGLFSDEGELVWEPERWEPGSANDQEWEANDQEWDKQSAQKAIGAHPRRLASKGDQRF